MQISPFHGLEELSANSTEMHVLHSSYLALLKNVTFFHWIPVLENIRERALLLCATERGEEGGRRHDKAFVWAEVGRIDAKYKDSQWKHTCHPLWSLCSAESAWLAWRLAHIYRSLETCTYISEPGDLHISKEGCALIA